MNAAALLALLQLTSPALPVGAYSYSEGLEVLIDRGIITNQQQLQQWIEESLATGSIGLEVAVLRQTQQAWRTGDLDNLVHWNYWLSATRESAELQQQNWQMGRSLLRLLGDLQSEVDWSKLSTALGENCNFVVAWSIAAELWGIDPETSALGYLHSWASNLVSAGIKLIPLGQTAGQQILVDINAPLITTVQQIQDRSPTELFTCSWGLALASMAHETQYSRLFRS
jgi:urease accessory protein